MHPSLETIVFATLAGLTILAAALWVTVFQRRRGARSARHARQQLVLDGIEVLARSMVQQQVNLTEASIRITALLDHLVDVPEPVVDTGPLRQFVEDTSGFVWGARRAALVPAERRRQDQARQALEVQHEAVVLAVAQAILDAMPTWRERYLEHAV